MILMKIYVLRCCDHSIVKNNPTPIIIKIKRMTYLHLYIYIIYIITYNV